MQEKGKILPEIQALITTETAVGKSLVETVSVQPKNNVQNKKPKREYIDVI